MNQEPHNADAATWAARLDAGPLTRDEAQALTDWLDADPANEGRLEEMQLVQQKVRRVLPAMAAAGQLTRSRRAWRRPSLAWVGAMAAVLAVGIFWLVQRPTTFTTGPAQRKVVVLPDGTKAELNARTTLRVRMRGTERRVQVDEGEIFFTVARDANRPFTVTTEAGYVRVTGTIFNFSSDLSGALRVVLVEGGVEAGAYGETPYRLTPGDEFAVADVAGLQRLDATELAEALAWRDGLAIFHETSLDLAVARFARHHAREIEIAPSVQKLALGGRFVLDDLDGFLRDLPMVLPVTVEKGSDGVVRIIPAPEGK